MCHARKTFTRSPFRRLPASVASTCSSTTPRRSGRCRWSRSPIPSARTSNWHWRPTSWVRSGSPERCSDHSRPRHGQVAGRWWSTSRATPPSAPYENWGAYGASKAALQHLSRIWDLELKSEGVGVVSVDPGDMDTPLHALAIPDADRSGLRRPEDSAREIADLIASRIAARPAEAGPDEHMVEAGHEVEVAP